MALERGIIWLLVFSIWLMSVECEGRVQCVLLYADIMAKLIYLLFKD